MICANCVNLLLCAYRFKLQYEHAQQQLEQFISLYQQKEEFIDIYVENDSDYEDKHSVIQQNQNSEIKVSFKKQKRVKGSQVSEQYSDSEVEEKSKEKQHPCPICTKEFTALELKKHAHTHKALKKYLTIPATEKIFPHAKFYTKPKELPERIALHNRKEKIHKCVYCNLEYTAEQLRFHLQTHKNQTEFKCDQCERVFKKVNHLNTHRVKHLKEVPYKCEHCDKGFVIKTNYDCHVLTHNTNQELPHECKICLKRFSNPEHLNRHMVMHTENMSYSVKYKVCKCHHCLKPFKDRSDLKKHHCVPIEQTLNTRYPCKSCSKVYKNASGLYNHNRTVHKLNGAKILCSVCGHCVSNIYNHMMRHNGVKPYQCNECGKRFMGTGQLRKHLMVHTGAKPYVCSVCAKAFNNLYNLQVHERIHKGDRCHICSICNKGFLEKSYLKKHMNVHTKLKDSV